MKEVPSASRPIAAALLRPTHHWHLRGSSHPAWARNEGHDRAPSDATVLATIISCRAGEPIYTQGSEADAWYRVLAGMARKCLHTSSGRRRIVDFLVPGDFFGMTAAERHVFGVEAVSAGTLVARYPRRQLERTAAIDPELAALIRDAAFATIARLQARLLIVGRVTAQGKVGAFLVTMARRTNVVVLPMSRYDVADYLAISVETVSRTLSQFKRCGAITTKGARCIEIADRSLLGRTADDDFDGLEALEFLTSDRF